MALPQAQARHSRHHSRRGLLHHVPAGRVPGVRRPGGHGHQVPSPPAPAAQVLCRRQLPTPHQRAEVLQGSRDLQARLPDRRRRQVPRGLLHPGVRLQLPGLHQDQPAYDRLLRPRAQDARPPVPLPAGQRLGGTRPVVPPHAGNPHIPVHRAGGRDPRPLHRHHPRGSFRLLRRLHRHRNPAHHRDHDSGADAPLVDGPVGGHTAGVARPEGLLRPLR